eukprot:4691275-Amphidinium_carterae.2
MFPRHIGFKKPQTLRKVETRDVFNTDMWRSSFTLHLVAGLLQVILVLRRPQLYTPFQSSRWRVVMAIHASRTSVHAHDWVAWEGARTNQRGARFSNTLLPSWAHKWECKYQQPEKNS